MNFIRSGLTIGSLLGQRSRQVTTTWSCRPMCSKPQETKSEHPPAFASGGRFKIPGYKPSEMEKKILIWSGRFKTADQIPEFVSFEMINAAKDKIRVKVCYAMIAVTIGGCFLMVFLGKQAAGRNESLTNQNMERKARWREEIQREREAKITMPEKAQ